MNQKLKALKSWTQLTRKGKKICGLTHTDSIFETVRQKILMMYIL